ncbi:MAG: IS200/IS605 family transposase [Anaerolineae bacterium]|nr:IS200/IS605 family transposase [Anaerolineae bacterium]
MPYSCCFYHIVWATRRRQPSIGAPHAQIIRAAINQKCEALGCKVFALNMVADHVHIALAIPPAHSVAEIVKHLKGAASRAVNVALRLEEVFAWQEGYGVHTLSERGMPTIVNYITRQQEHHAANTLITVLERMTE